MKKKIFLNFILAILLLQFLQVLPVYAYPYLYQPNKAPDGAIIYTNTSFPIDATKNDIDRSTLRSGTSCARNILGIAEVGDASIEEAAKKADITKIKYVDTKISKVYVPLLFIPIYVKEIKTTVYGE